MTEYTISYKFGLGEEAVFSEISIHNNFTYSTVPGVWTCIKHKNYIEFIAPEASPTGSYSISIFNIICEDTYLGLIDTKEFDKIDSEENGNSHLYDIIKNSSPQVGEDYIINVLCLFFNSISR